MINNGPENIYIQSVQLNGKAHNKTYISHNDIMEGGTLRFVMDKTPNQNYGKSAETRPL